MAIDTKTVRNARVFFDDRYNERWIDAIGQDVIKYLGTLAQDGDSTNNAANFTVTATSDGSGTSNIAKSTEAGELFLIACAAGEYDGINAQLEGESFQLDANMPAYFGIRVQSNDADQCDLAVGLIETDTTIFAVDTAHAIAVSGDGIFFSSLDGATTIFFKTYEDGSETNTATATAVLADDTWITLEFYWDGTSLYGYANDTLVGAFTANYTDEELTPSIAYLTGEGVANTCRVQWMRAIQCR